MHHGPRQLSIAKNRHSLWFRKSMRCQIDVQVMLGNGDIDGIRANTGSFKAKIGKGDPWALVYDLVEDGQICFRDDQVVEILVVVFEELPIFLSSPVNLIRGTHAVGQPISGGKCLTRRAVPGSMLIQEI